MFVCAARMATHWPSSQRYPGSMHSTVYLAVCLHRVESSAAGVELCGNTGPGCFGGAGTKGNKRFCLLAHVLRNRKANLLVIVIIDCEELLEERNAEHEERSLWWRHVQAHQ